MYCTKCGNKVEDNAIFCIKCGNKLKDNETNNVINEGATKQNSVNINLIVKIILLICIVCFFMPFATVSCSDRQVTATGIEIATGSFSNSLLEQEEVSPNVFVAAALALTAIALILSFRNSNDATGVSSASAISAAFLILFMCTFKAYYKIESEDLAYLTINFNFALWASMILNIVVAVLTYKSPQKYTCNKCGLCTPNIFYDEENGTYLCENCAIEHWPSENHEIYRLKK